jgi:hypothetical protein
MDAALIMLDARSFRDKPVTILDYDIFAFPSMLYDDDRTMLGAKQLSDMLDDLQDAQNRGITWKFVLLPEPIQNLGNIAAPDRYEGYSHERGVILEYIEDHCIANVVFISGDIHGTIANNLTYKKDYLAVKNYSATWDISTGPIGYTPPYGPQIANRIGALDGQYESLDRDGQNALIEALMVPILTANRFPQIGLGFEPPYPPPPFGHPENAFTPATLLRGRYSSTNTFGWTEFEIDAATQKLTVTTWGIDSYGSPAPDLVRDVFVASQFEVAPVVQAADGGGCLNDKDCLSCRCSLLGGVGNNDLAQCVARLPNGSVCIGNGQCESGRCSLGLCKPKAPNGGDCLNDNDCELGNCSGLLCRPSPSDFNCGDDGASRCVCTSDEQCLSDRCSLGTCRDRLSNGENCLNDNDCKSDRCSLGECKAKLPNGESCLNDSDCRSDTCAGFVCTDEDNRPNGQFCTLDSQCASKRCSGFECRPKVANDEPCLNDNDCSSDDCSGGYCRPSTNGTPCVLDSSCESGRCSLGTCSDKAANGDNCLSDSDCQSGRCSLGFCLAKQPNGEPCLNDNDCQSDRCSLGFCKACEPAGSGCASDGECCSKECSFFTCD